DQALFLGHHLLGNLNISGRKNTDQGLSISRHPTGINRAWAKRDVGQAFVRSKKYRISRTMCLFQEGGLLRIQGLCRRKNDLHPTPAVGFTGGLIVTAWRIPEFSIATFRRHQTLSSHGDVIGFEGLSSFVNSVGVVVVLLS